MNTFLIEAVAELARAKGLDPWQARAHMVLTLALMDRHKSVYLAVEDAQMRRWSRVYR
jgi:hypothetical protein